MRARLKYGLKMLLPDLVFGILVPLLIAAIGLYQTLSTPGYTAIVDKVPITDVACHASKFRHAWVYHDSFPNYEGGTPLTLLVMVAVTSLGFSSQVADKVTCLFAYAIPGIGMYFATRHFFKLDKRSYTYYAACMVASIGFMINTISMVQSLVYTRNIAYGLLPLSIALYHKLVSDEKRTFLNASMLAITLYLIMGTFLSILLIVLLVMFAHQIYRILSERNVKMFLKDFSKLALVGVIVMGFSFEKVTSPTYPFERWFIRRETLAIPAAPQLPQIEYVLEGAIAQWYSPFNVMMLNLSWIHWGKIGLWMFAFLFIPLIASSILIKRFRNSSLQKIVLAHGILMFVGIIFSVRSLPIGYFNYVLAEETAKIHPLFYQFWLRPESWVDLYVYGLVFLFGVATYYIVTWFKKRPRFLKHIGLIPLVALVASPWFIYSGYPNGGDLYGAWHPVEIPSAYFKANDFLEHDQSLYRVWWVPHAVELALVYKWHKWSVVGLPNLLSKKPNLMDSEYVRFIYAQRILEEKTQDLGKLLAPLGVKYIILHEDVSTPQYSLWNEDELTMLPVGLMIQPDFDTVYTQDFIRVFKNEQFINPVYASGGIGLVVGGLDTMCSVIASSDYDPLKMVLVSSEQIAGRYLFALLNASDYVFFSGFKGLEDLYLQFDERDFIDPMLYTNHWKPDKVWSTRTEQDTFMNLPGLHDTEQGRHLLHEGDFFYGKDVVLTSAVGARLNVTLRVKDADLYELWARVMLSPVGGKLDFLLDDKELNVTDTVASTPHVKWVKVNEQLLAEGRHELTIVNANGTNFVDMLLLSESSYISNLKNMVLNELSKKNVFIVINARADQPPDIWIYSEEFEAEPISPTETVAVAQTFTAVTPNLAMLEIRGLTRTGATGNLVAELRTVDEFGSPSQEILASTKVSTELVAEDLMLPVWIPILLRYEGLEVGRTYAIVLRTEGSDPGERFRIAVTKRSLPDLYPEGKFFVSNDGKSFISVEHRANTDLIMSMFARAPSIFPVLFYSWDISHETLMLTSHWIRNDTVTPPTVNYTMPFSGRYVVEAESNDPFVLVIPEEYNELWDISGQDALTFPAFSHQTAFYIQGLSSDALISDNLTSDDLISHELTVEYAANKLFSIGIHISNATWLIVIFIVIFIEVYRRYIVKKNWRACTHRVRVRIRTKFRT